MEKDVLSEWFILFGDIYMRRLIFDIFRFYCAECS